MDENELIARYVELNPHRPGEDEARLRDYGVSIWAIVSYLNGMSGDVDRVAKAYAVPRDAIEAALAYYRRHKTAIDARIAANLAAFR